MALSLASIWTPAHYQRGSTNVGALGLWSAGTCSISPDGSEFLGPTGFRLDFAGGSTVVAGVRWKVARPRLTADEILAFYAGSTQVGRLTRVAAGTLSPAAYTGSLSLETESGTLYEGSTPTAQIGENVYAFVVLAMRTIGAGSAFKVLVNDGIRTSLTSGSTTLTARTIDSVQINAPRASIKDGYVLFGSGAFGADDLWSASGGASYLAAAQVGDYAGANWEAWDGSAGLAQPVSEQQEDGDTTYILDRTSPTGVPADRVSYKVATVSRLASVIRGVEPIAMARLSYGASAGYKVCLSQGLTDSKGSEITETSNYIYGSRPLRFSPFTGGSTLFSVAELATTDWGVEQTTLA